ncbi:MAG: sigma-54 dependent transcriptional regulator [Bryobacterales bacterium]
MNQTKRILVVDDEAKMLRVLELQLQTAGFQVTKAESAEIGIKLFDAAVEDGKPFALVMTDLRLPGMDGLAFLREVRKRDGAPPVVVMTAFGTVETAVEAMKAGASDYLLKPFSLEDMMITLEKVLELHALRRENRELKEELTRRYDFGQIIGRSEKMREIFETAKRVAPTRATVLLGGESGVGKGMLARAIHLSSPRRDAPFVKIACSAIPENPDGIPSCSATKAPFTSAVRSHPGKFEQADGGTVFLDEIGDVPASVQVKLLRVLQEREFERLGSTKTVQVDVRIIAATNQDLRLLGARRFARPLLPGSTSIPIQPAPLRERQGRHRLPGRPFPAPVLRKTPAAAYQKRRPGSARKLKSYHWPAWRPRARNIISAAWCSPKATSSPPTTSTSTASNAPRQRPAASSASCPTA